MSVIIERRSDLQTVTPMMSQYLEIKNQYDGYILMYRLGDFYECFYEDALIASKVLELTLTSRDCGDGKRAAMCGVPFHKADIYIARLVEKGYKVAVCEQIGDPKEAVGLVKRSVTRVVTPGTITDGSVLSDSENNFLLSLCYGKSGAGVGFVDVSTGEISVTFVCGDDMETKIHNEIHAYQPSEAIINLPIEKCTDLNRLFAEKMNTLANFNAARLFDYDRARDLVKTVFSSEYDKLTEPEMIMSVGALVAYINETQKSSVTFVKELNVYSKGQFLELDANTRRNLELVESMRTKDKRGSLLSVIDKCETAMGKRLLHSWLLRPLLNPVLISKRQSAVADLFKDAKKRSALAQLLSDILDLERLTARAVYGSANPKELKAICSSIKKLPEIKSLISDFESDSIRSIANQMDTLDDIANLLDDALVNDPPLSVRDGGIIKEGFNADIDYYRSIKENGSAIMDSIEEREKEATGIKTLKVKFNKIFGYYIEVSKSFINDVPDRYIRKQTLTNCERYITQELKDMETTILSADEKLVNLEYELFVTLRNFISDNCTRIRNTATLIAELDVYVSFATVASRNGYVRPEVDLSDKIYIKDGRHPVVEKFVRDSYFVPNDTSLDTSKNRIMMITGPNMAGKSTYMRQVAIITIMAQIGSFIPTHKTNIGIVDKVFTRVGASDDLASGQSTFMLEMNEVAAILKNATRRSLIIYDEVGRGTSTFDGMAIARAVVEYTHSKKIGAKTLFATHYHELVDMEDSFEGIVNYNIAAKKRGDSVIFLRKIVRGGTDDSYGIEVAKLAGIPSEVIRRAKEILLQIEQKSTSERPTPIANNTEPDLFTAIIASRDSEVAEKIREVDINTLTPIEAMNLLYELKKILND